MPTGTRQPRIGADLAAMSVDELLAELPENASDVKTGQIQTAREDLERAIQASGEPRQRSARWRDRLSKLDDMLAFPDPDTADFAALAAATVEQAALNKRIGHALEAASRATQLIDAVQGRLDGLVGRYVHARAILAGYDQGAGNYGRESEARRELAEILGDLRTL